MDALDIRKIAKILREAGLTRDKAAKGRWILADGNRVVLYVSTPRHPNGWCEVLIAPDAPNLPLILELTARLAQGRHGK